MSGEARGRQPSPGLAAASALICVHLWPTFAGRSARDRTPVVDHLALRRIRPITVLLVALIVVLGYSLVVRQHREARLRAALASYKGRATGDLTDILGRSVGMDWPEDTPLAEAIEQIKASAPPSWGFTKGLPILVDPDGLREAGQSLGSPLRAAPPDELDGKAVPLRQK